MNVRALLEERERKIFSPYARFSCASRGREKQEDACQVRTVFQHDRDKILHSKSFRRLKHKTQVFFSPEGDHYRTRLTHTLEVSQIARTVARALSLNEDLTEAIALGHDLGHTPFGHAGERVLNGLMTRGFHHVRQSLRVVEILEKGGEGLNLTWEVRDGILRHSKGSGPLLTSDPAAMPSTLEGKIVRRADIIAYVNHDLDDALRSGVIEVSQIPRDILAELGQSQGRRIDNMVRDMIARSLEAGGGEIVQSRQMEEAILALRDWLYANVYRARSVHDDFSKTMRILHDLFTYFMENEEELLLHGGRRIPGDELDTSVGDFIAGMTDRYAVNLYHKLFIPQPWKIL